MRDELIGPAATLAAAVIDKMQKQHGQDLQEAIAEAFAAAYRGIELAEKSIDHQDQYGYHP